MCMSKDRKPIVMISSDEELIRIDAEAEKQKAEMKATLELLFNQRNANHKWFWGAIEKRLGELNVLPPDYDPETWNLNIENGVIFAGKTEGEDDIPAEVPDFVKSLIKAARAMPKALPSKEAAVAM